MYTIRSDKPLDPVELAGAALLGHDAGLLLEVDTALAIRTILADPAKRDRLLIHMGRSIGASATTPSALLEAFERALLHSVK